MPAWLRPLLARVHAEVSSRLCGCGLVEPPLPEGCRVLDLGCGKGRDGVLLSQLVGPGGSVVGVDRTPGPLAVARRHQAFHAQAIGHANISFLEGTIGDLEELPLEPASFEVVVSNGVLNLSGDKPALLRGAQRLLRPGGVFSFSDVDADRRLPAAARRAPGSTACAWDAPCTGTTARAWPGTRALPIRGWGATDPWRSPIRPWRRCWARRASSLPAPACSRSRVRRTPGKTTACR